MDMSIDSLLLQRRQLQHCGSPHSLINGLSQSIYYRFGRYGVLAASKEHDFPYGSVFNVEFDPTSGSTVVVAHSNKAVTIHDTRLERRVAAVPNAHSDCVNIVTFLDNYAFATGSDDGTIRLWDSRQCDKGLVAVLRGHTGWVKNIEFDRRTGHLFSIAFNDGIRKWDINKTDEYSSEENATNLLFKVEEGVRMRLSPDGSTMIVSLRKNHLFIVTKFDCESIGSIWNSFPRNMPPSTTDTRNIENFSDNTNNVPLVHSISPFTEGNYRTPLSFVFHPSSQFLAMRVIDVKLQRLVQELSVLYDVRKMPEKPKPFYNMDSNISRFIKYCDEESPESAMDFIKEISFSTDGRILASPFGESVRLLAIDTACTPMDLHCDDRYHSKEKSLASLEFEEVCICRGHKYPVLTSRLNSDTMCLASGCVEGRVIFNWPRL